MEKQEWIFLICSMTVRLLLLSGVLVCLVLFWNCTFYLVSSCDEMRLRKGVTYMACLNSLCNSSCFLHEQIYFVQDGVYLRKKIARQCAQKLVSSLNKTSIRGCLWTPRMKYFLNVWPGFFIARTIFFFCSWAFSFSFR